MKECFCDMTEMINDNSLLLTKTDLASQNILYVKCLN